MTTSASILDVFPSLHVLVVGDAMLDVYVRGHASRLCPEAAVPILDFEERVETPGGAANTAVNLQALGAKVSLLSVVGRDRDGQRLCDSLTRRGIDTRHVLVHPQRRTLVKQRVVAESQLVVRIDEGDTRDLPAPDEFTLAARLRAAWPKCDAIVLSDYGYGVIGPEMIAMLAEMSHRLPTVLVGDSKRLTRFEGVRFSAVKPNYAQACDLLCLERLDGAARIEQILKHGPTIFHEIDTQAAALTLDQDGAIVLRPDQPPLRTFTHPNPHTQAAGAGDTYVAGLALGLAASGDIATAAEIAAAAAAIVVEKDGTSCCTHDELQTRLTGHSREDYGLEALCAMLHERRRRGHRIVLTNGCFDILHRGHITYLNQARQLGDVLVVGVNSDDSIQRLKGPERPINSLEDRMQVLAALSCVDHVVAFDDDTPHRLVHAIRPHIFVKGGDYTRERLPEAALVEELGGRVEILPLVRERSTTKIISRIRSQDSPASAIAPSAGLISPPFSARLS
jgi:D-beta-D-heptose 7-phosphate kinase/D-beta-D-heptose 1-phosphate adenosyltransferase